jgi:hypothetical protein
MLTRRIDAALNALSDCRNRVPELRDIYRPDTPERAALDDVLAALQRAGTVLRITRPASDAGACPHA